MKIIPVFLPYAGCQHRCVFCDQIGATGVSKRMSPKELKEYIDKFFLTGKVYELAFYGGTFTGLPKDVQKSYLEVVESYIKTGKISYIRISTRPDEIDRDLAKFLKSYGVKFIEIGAQSMNDEVLKASKRGHTSADVVKAIEILKEHNFKIGVHLMVGLPKSTFESDLNSAQVLSNLGIDTARIHPTLVFKGTELCRMLRAGDYKPLELQDAVKITAEMLAVFESKGVKVIRLGLHVPVELRENICAGPYHPSFGDLVRSYMVRMIVDKLNVKKIEVTSRQMSWAYSNGNKEYFKNRSVKIMKSNEFRFDGKSYRETLKMYLEAKGK